MPPKNFKKHCGEIDRSLNSVSQVFLNKEYGILQRMQSESIVNLFGKLCLLELVENNMSNIIKRNGFKAQKETVLNEVFIYFEYLMANYSLPSAKYAMMHAIFNDAKTGVFDVKVTIDCFLQIIRFLAHKEIKVVF